MPPENASSEKLTRRERIVLFAVFALGLAVAISHEWDLPAYCLRLLGQ